MTRTHLLSAPLLLLAVAASASAQDVPFTPFRSGAMAPPQAVTGNTLIRSQAELRQAGLERLMPVGESFDFQSESLVALVMPQQSTGGISIGVESIKQSGQALEVTYRVRRPAPGSFATTVVTRPFSLVRIAASALPARFVAAGSSSPGGGGLLPPGQMPFHVVSHGNQASASLPSGNVFVTSAAELASSGLASLVPDPSAINWSAEQLAILVMPQQSSGGVSIAVKKVMRRITPFSTPGGAAGGGLHYEVQFEVLRAVGGGATATVMTRPFQVIRFSRGRAVFKELNAAPAPLLPPGQLPFHVVAAGDQADFNLTSGQFLVRSASELASSGLAGLVPSPSAIRWDQEMLAILLLDVQTRAGYGVEVTKVLQRITPSAGPGGSLGGARHLEIQFETKRPAPSGGVAATVMNRPFQVVRLPKASRAVFKEVSAPATTFSGVVRVQRAFGGVTFVTLEEGSERFYLSPRSFAQSLAPLAGQRVTIDADRNPSVPSFLSAKRLISPEAYSGMGFVRGSANAPTLFDQGQALRLEGQLASTLGEHAMGRLIQGVEGFRFADGRLLLTSFRATVRHPATVTVNSRRVNRLQPGEAVTVTGRSRSGKSLVVEPAQGAGGYVTTWRLNLGPSPVLLTPPATPSTGVTGALGGASGQ